MEAHSTSDAPRPPGSGDAQAGDIAGAFALLAGMTRDFADTLDLEATLEHGLSSIVAHLDAEAGSLWLLDDDKRELTCRASVGPNPITGLSLPVSQGIVGRSVRENACQSVLDVSKDPGFMISVDQKSGLATRSLLCAPLSVSDEALGAIELVNRRGAGRCFAEADIHLLQVLASSAALAIANARMAANLVDAERLRRELELAAEIQRNLLPAPHAAPFPAYGVNVPARTVSGDFFDIVELPDGRIGFCLGDVSGKGMNAALLMAKTASLYRCLAKTVERPGELIGTLNDEIADTATRGMFVTMVLGVFDPKNGRVALTNAGHEPPLVHSPSGGFCALPAQAPPLGIATGIVPGGTYPEREFRLSGGALYVFSDGLTEACTRTGDPLGSPGLERLIAANAGKPLAERVHNVIAEVGELDPRDDLTLLALCDTARGGR
ncbi:MAG: SpoIIE family protein phosphatase [Deltaproteobacteria bacterium]|nr:MAG: SpoIIE family protein phosphatase [Deltaproteobacteria bacterium]